MDEHTPSKRWSLHVVCAVAAGLLFLAAAALILSASSSSEPTIRPAPAAGPRPYHSIWPRDYLVWYA